MMDILNKLIYERSFYSSATIMSKERLLSDKNHSSQLNFQITQRLYAHPVRRRKPKTLKQIHAVLNFDA